MFEWFTNLFKKKEKEDLLTFRNWSIVLNSACIYYIVETTFYNKKLQKEVDCWGIRITLFFNQNEDERLITLSTKAIMIPCNYLFTKPILAAKYIQKYLGPFFNGTSPVVLVMDKENKIIDKYDIMEDFSGIQTENDDHLVDDESGLPEPTNDGNTFIN